jgi:hypothetical protein
MLHKRVKLSALLLFGLALAGLQAQQIHESIPATGGNASGNGGSASYSVGLVFYNTSDGTSGSVSQGVQQPFEISVVTGINETKGITLQCTVYPNPAIDFLTLKVENYTTEALTYHLCDVNGKLLDSQKMEGNDAIIAMSNLISATYFLKVIQGNKELKTFKIIKY